MKVLVTGASGFIGKYLCQSLSEQRFELTIVTRTKTTANKNITAINKVLGKGTDWKATLVEIDIVIHLAGRAHVMQENEHNPYKSYREINVEATLNLAKQAISAGVKRFIYISSIKVNGERTANHRFTELDQPQPEDDYGKSKYEAEQALTEIAKGSGMDVVIIRPPLVYGNGVKANFLNLIKLSQFKLPLPFGAIHNKRSLIYIENLIDFIMVCMTHPKAANETFLISDDEDVSTTQLIKYLREANQQAPLLIPVPQSWLSFLFKILGKPSLADRLCGNLQVDISKAKTLLNWRPKFSVKAGINKTISIDK